MVIAETEDTLFNKKKTEALRIVFMLQDFKLKDKKSVEVIRCLVVTVGLFYNTTLVHGWHQTILKFVNEGPTMLSGDIIISKR